MSEDSEGGERRRWEPSPDLLPGAPPPEEPSVGPTYRIPAPPDPPPARPSPPTTYHPPTYDPPGYGSPDEPAADVPDRSTRNRVLVIAAVVLAIVAASVVTAVVISSDDGGDRVSDTTTTTATPTTTTIPSGERELLDGVVAVVPAGALTPAATLEADLVELPDGLGAMVAAGPIVDLRVEGGRMLKPIRLEFALSGASIAPDGGQPTVSGFYRAASTPTFPTGELSTDGRTYAVDVDAPGTVGALTWDWDAFDGAATAAFDGLVDGTGPSGPSVDCSDDLDGDELVIAGAGDAIEWCGERDGNDRVVYAANTSAFPVTVSWSGPVEALRNASSAPDLDVGPLIDGWTSDSALTLGPGEQAMFTAAAGDDVSLVAALDDTARSGAALLGDLVFVSVVQELLPGADGTGTARGVLDRIDPVCAAGGGTPDALLAACFPEDALTAIVGASAARPSAALFSTEVLGQVVGDAAGAVEPTMLRRADSSADLTGRRVASWPIEDRADSDDLRWWLDQMDLDADWSRCEDRLCIAGVGESVEVVQFDSGEVVANVTLDIDEEDPYQALLDIGVPEDLAGRLVDGH